ncbi:MAG: hypothetical protein ABI718_17810, partial [Acidobacteriota bacterium]
MRPKDLFNEERAGNREGGRDPSHDAQDDNWPWCFFPLVQRRRCAVAFKKTHGALVILKGAQRPKDLFNEELAGNREGGRDPSLDAQDDS